MQSIIQVAGDKLVDSIYDNMSKEQVINVLEQVQWERDIAIGQLRDDYNVDFGEKRPTAKWVYNPNAVDWNIGGYECSHCGYVNTSLPTTKFCLKTDYAASHYCAQCGYKMIGYQNEPVQN